MFSSIEIWPIRSLLIPTLRIIPDARPFPGGQSNGGIPQAQLAQVLSACLLTQPLLSASMANHPAAGIDCLEYLPDHWEPTSDIRATPWGRDLAPEILQKIDDFAGLNNIGVGWRCAYWRINEEGGFGRYASRYRPCRRCGNEYASLHTEVSSRCIVCRVVADERRLQREAEEDRKCTCVCCGYRSSQHLQRCGGCAIAATAARYCSRSCQKRNWAEHRLQCDNKG